MNRVQILIKTPNTDTSKERGLHTCVVLAKADRGNHQYSTSIEFPGGDLHGKNVTFRDPNVVIPLLGELVGEIEAAIGWAADILNGGPVESPHDHWTVTLS